MPQPLVTDALWAIVTPVLPPERPKPKGGRPRVPDRAALTGILFVLKSGVPWGVLPQELGCGSGMTCWRRLRDWQRAGVWRAVHRQLLDRLGRSYRIDWSRAALDSASVPTPAGGEHTGKNPTDRGKLGTKHHLIVDRHGIPLAAEQSAANVHDSKLLEATVDAIRPIRMAYGRPRRRPAKLHTDKGYDFDRCRAALRRRGIASRIARGGVDSSERLGRFRWVVERTLSWLHRFRRLRIRYERRADLHLAWPTLGCALLCLRSLGSDGPPIQGPSPCKNGRSRDIRRRSPPRAGGLAAWR